MIESPADPELAELTARLSELSNELDRSGAWPREQLELCGRYGVYRWFLDPAWGGRAWNEADVTRGYLALSAACLTTTFIITQRTGACRRIQSCENTALKERLLPELASGERFATVGISHLTTSRRHLARPVLRARRVDGGYRLDGFSPWVTGAPHAEVIVCGATLVDTDQGEPLELLCALPIDTPGVVAAGAEKLVGLGASDTGAVQLDDVFVDDRDLVAGPIANVMSSGVGGTAGGLQTSTLAVGLAEAALDFLRQETVARPDLEAAHGALFDDHQSVRADLLAAADGTPACSTEELRQRANSIALRSTQAALAAAKGTGYVVGHPTGRWCREALFFLVWSCPEPVLHANLCELAGIQ